VGNKKIVLEVSARRLVNEGTALSWKISRGLPHPL
jgi:hypothetical protein